MTRSLLSITFAAAVLVFPPLQATQSYGTLRSAHIFSLGGVGIAGTHTPEEKAYDVLIQASDAEQQLCRLLAEGNTIEGKMYALYGFRQLRVRDYWTLAMPYRKRHDLVNMAFGCMVSHQPLSDLVPGYIDHAYPK
jgi:hypothetical protein